jgi:hypothetical protein
VGARGTKAPRSSDSRPGQPCCPGWRSLAAS